MLLHKPVHGKFHHPGYHFYVHTLSEMLQSGPLHDFLIPFRQNLPTLLYFRKRLPHLFLPAPVQKTQDTGITFHCLKMGMFYLDKQLKIIGFLRRHPRGKLQHNISDAVIIYEAVESGLADKIVE